MTEISYTTMSKEAWGDGPWQDEPDKIQYTDEDTGLPCLIKRNRWGALCGYVGVDQDHPWFGKSYYEVNANVHGGLTYAAACDDGPEESSICHIPKPGEPDHVWWFGFDCGHAWDHMPGLTAAFADADLDLGDFLSQRTTYKTVGFVRQENKELAQQLAEVAA